MKKITNSTFLSSLWASIPESISVNKPQIVIVGGIVASIATIFFINLCCRCVEGAQSLFDRGEHMTIFVKGLSGMKLSFEVFQKDRIKVLVNELVKKGWAERDIRLLFHGHQLEFDSKFADYNILKESTIEFVIKVRGD